MPVLGSLTRIAPFERGNFQIQPLPQSAWETGDYVVSEIDEPPQAEAFVEVRNGRMARVSMGDQVVGALGEREATLEVTGTWREVDDDGQMHVLTSAGLMGLLTSKSPYQSAPMSAVYRGHVFWEGEKAAMRRFAPSAEPRAFTVPTVLMTGTSMSAGKTTAARAIIRELKQAGLRVLGAKLTGAGRYRDILSMHDAGADWMYDFVDVGLPSTVYPEREYRTRMRELLSMMAAHEPDVAIVEIGSSPLEPYNGQAAIDILGEAVQCTVLAASDPYAVYGVMEGFAMTPDFVCGIAANTNAGIRLIERLCDVPALNVVEPASRPALRRILERTLDVEMATDSHQPSASK